MNVLIWSRFKDNAPKWYFGVCTKCKTPFRTDKNDTHAVYLDLASDDVSHYAYCPYCFGVTKLKEVDMNAPNLSKEDIQAVPMLQKFGIDWLLKAVNENSFKIVEELIVYVGEQVL